MRRSFQQAPAVEFVAWKPDVCEVEGCEAKHPAFSRDGMPGPWRCREHDLTATMRREPTGGPMPKKQDGLL
jgi:hypothetical protein